MAEREESPATPAVAADEIEVEPLFPVRGYVLLNVLFWGFCALEAVLIRLWLGDIQGVIFFFVLLSIGFTVVSVYDAIYDRMRLRTRERQLQAAAQSGKA